jgi:hypothetical protein
MRRLKLPENTPCGLNKRVGVHPTMYDGPHMQTTRGRLVPNSISAIFHDLGSVGRRTDLINARHLQGTKVSCDKYIIVI